MSELIAAVDAVVDYVRQIDDHSGAMTEIEAEEFRRLADDAYILIYRAGLHDAAPQVAKLNSQIDVERLPAPTFISKLNLPGDWDDVRDEAYAQRLEEPLGLPSWEDDRPAIARQLLIYPHHGWFDDMAVLRSLIESVSGATSTANNEAIAIETLLGEESRQILEIARSDKSAGDKMEAILRIDSRFLSWESPQWADLLKVSGGAIRKSPFWKEVQRLRNAGD